MKANKATWLTRKQKDLEVGPVLDSRPRDNEIVVRNRAVAVNPVDRMKQRAGDFTFFVVQYPFILESDKAGEVVEVGRLTSRFKTGDRVLADAMGMTKNETAPPRVRFRSTPSCLDTWPPRSRIRWRLRSACAAPWTFYRGLLALSTRPACPGISCSKCKGAGQTVLIWGGSTSVGSNAIQLAMAAGYDVVTTASPVNFNYCRGVRTGVVFATSITGNGLSRVAATASVETTAPSPIAVKILASRAVCCIHCKLFHSLAACQPDHDGRTASGRRGSPRIGALHPRRVVALSAGHGR